MVEEFSDVTIVASRFLVYKGFLLQPNSSYECQVADTILVGRSHVVLIEQSLEERPIHEKTLHELHLICLGVFEYKLEEGFEPFLENLSLQMDLLEPSSSIFVGNQTLLVDF